MIRREIQLPEQPPHWVMISQVEHARLSGVLAEHSLSHFEADVRNELVQAVIHHDDGWTAFEAEPQLDPRDGRPLSFRELPLKASLPIWTDSINAAANHGPLAGWVVAGHFLALLTASEKPRPGFVSDWQQRTVAKQTDCLAQWTAQDPARHTPAVAEQALLWLQLLDVMTLWLCSACPGTNETVTQPPADYRVNADQPLETVFSCDQDRVLIRPWHFDVPELELTAHAQIATVQKYESAQHLLENSAAYKLHWQLADRL